MAAGWQKYLHRVALTAGTRRQVVMVPCRHFESWESCDVATATLPIRRLLMVRSAHRSTLILGRVLTANSKLNMNIYQIRSFWGFWNCAILSRCLLLFLSSLLLAEVFYFRWRAIGVITCNIDSDRYFIMRYCIVEAGHECSTWSHSDKFPHGDNKKCTVSHRIASYRKLHFCSGFVYLCTQNVKC